MIRCPCCGGSDVINRFMQDPIKSANQIVMFECFTCDQFFWITRQYLALHWNQQGYVTDHGVCITSFDSFFGMKI